MSEAVYKMVLDFLHVTSELDESSKSRIAGEIADGMAYLRKYCDPSATFEPGTEHAGKLCEYVLRAESGARDSFGVDFASDIISSKAAYDARVYAEASGYVEG